LRPCDEATIRRTLLPPWKALELGHCVKQDAAQDCANAWDGLEEGQGLGIVWLRRCEDQECKSVQPLSIIGDESTGDLKGLWHGDILTTLGSPGPVGLVGNLLAALGQGRLAVGIVPMRSKCRACAPQGRAASEQVAGGAHLRRRDRGWWKHAAAEQRRHLLGSALVVFGLAAVQGFPGESLPQHAGAACCGPYVGEPGPGEETLDGHDQAGTRGRHSLEQRCRRGWHGAVEQPCAIVAQDADVQTPGMQVDTAVKGVLIGGESP
jgi:hypothetical protein